MNIILNTPPKDVEIGGKLYPINSDFRIGIQFDSLMNDFDLDNKDKIVKAIELYYPIIPHDLNEAIAKMLWFFSCGVVEESKEQKGIAIRIYSFEHDDKRIYSAFRRYHNIDLNDAEYMHWWKFRNLMFDVGDCEFERAIKYRATKINPKMSAEEKKHLAEMKRVYAIPDKRTHEQKVNAFAKAMFGLMRLPQEESEVE